MKRLILGGDKSGKSAHALGLALGDPAPRLLLATGRALDTGFRDQILDHRRGRSPDLPVREVDTDLASAIEESASQAATLLVEGLDFWLFRRLEAELGPGVEELARAVAGARVDALTMVSCEAGLGPLPASAQARRFLRELGAMNQALAAACDQVVLVVAGLPMTLKGE